MAQVRPQCAPAMNNSCRSQKKCDVAPSPGCKREAQRYAKSKPDRATDEKTGPGRIEYDQRIIHWNADKGRIHRQNGDVGTPADHNLRVGSQVAIIPGLFPLPLHRIHHILLLRQKGVTQLRGPIHVRSHHLQHRWKRNQRLHAGIPRKMVFGNGSGQVVPSEVVMLVRLFGGVGNLIRIRRRGEDLCKQRVRIKRNPGDQLVEFLWWVRRRRRLSPHKPGSSSR